MNTTIGTITAFFQSLGMFSVSLCWQKHHTICRPSPVAAACSYFAAMLMLGLFCLIIPFKAVCTSSSMMPVSMLLSAQLGISSNTEWSVSLVSLYNSWKYSYHLVMILSLSFRMFPLLSLTLFILGTCCPVLFQMSICWHTLSMYLSLCRFLSRESCSVSWVVRCCF